VKRNENTLSGDWGLELNAYENFFLNNGIASKKASNI
jgi:hypothetical protein